uniref:Phlebovirus_G2 domain-containing protein n=1 Tax=Caenorhabditis japonica TaxID=281687 RepID=A0A8R1IIT1_CAEJA
LKRERVRRSRWRALFTIIIFIKLSQLSQQCQEVDVITQFEKVCDTDGTCQTLTEEIVHLNSLHNEGCLRINRNETVLRDIRIQLTEIELHCVKRTITYTQDIETRVWSTKRCPHTGSCVNDKCANITRQSIIPELNSVNHYVGNTGCWEGCGGPGCGCFYWSSGCLFYKIYALPKSTQPLEIYSCMDYQPSAKLKLTVTTLNSWKNKVETVEILSPI